jgi:hypothetical protein
MTTGVRSPGTLPKGGHEVVSKGQQVGTGLAISANHMLAIAVEYQVESRGLIVRKTLAAILGGLVLILSVTGIALAHYNTGVYTYRDSACTNQEDPMNITFYNNATASNTDTHVVHHMNWNDTSGSTSYFSDHGQCLAAPDGSAGIQRASAGLTASERDHIRYRQGVDSDSNWGTYSAASVHHEVIRICGMLPNHVVTDFNNVRNGVVSAFRNQSGHGTELWATNNNTAPSPQCDGSQPRSDGKTAWLRIP